MAKKTFKLTKNALMLLGLIVLAMMIVIVLQFGSKKQVKIDNKYTLDSLVVENQVLKVELLDFISTKDYNDKYQEVLMKISANEDICGYSIESAQTFKKAMQLLPPNDQMPLLNNNSETPSHEAYVLVLIGDIVHYKNDQGDGIYKVVNARLSYYKQSLLLENDYDSVYIASLDGKKEKMVKIKAYKQALSNKDEYMSMLQW